MLKTIDRLLKKISPRLHASLKKRFRSVKKKVNAQISRDEFVKILEKDLLIRPGDVLFIHSSMRNLYLDFGKQEILDILRLVVGPEGTLLFPCWQFNNRAEDYIREHEIVFDLRHTPSAMGKIPDALRSDPTAFRSFHPTNSVIAIGPHARELTAEHETDIYPCGEKSPWRKMLKYNARIVGIGVQVDSLTFVHSIEDELRTKFPLKTRNDEIFPCKCIDANGAERTINTLVASPAIGRRDVYEFFRKHISRNIYRDVHVKGMPFFSLDAVPAYEEIKQKALANQTIYRFD